MKKGLTITVIFKAMSANYGESIGNISELKKLVSSNETYTYISRQALRYEIYRCMKENFGMDNDLQEPLVQDQKVAQFSPNANAAKYVEADLFGYMKTEKNKGSVIRPAVVRISPAFSLEPYQGDIEFGTNKNFADRLKKDPDPFQFEHHLSLYSYTINIDLNRVGIDENDGETVSSEEKIRRINMVLDAVQILNRDIKGRAENLNPLFAIGGVYPVKNPFFLGRIKTTFDKDKKAHKIDTDILKSVLSTKYHLDTTLYEVKNDTKIGFLESFWANENELKKLNEQSIYSIANFFEELKSKVKEYYENTKN